MAFSFSYIFLRIGINLLNEFLGLSQQVFDILGF